MPTQTLHEGGRATGVRGVIFDLFGTLVPYVRHEEMRESLLPTVTTLGCSVEEFERVWCTKEAFTNSVTQTISPETLIGKFCEQLELRVDDEVIREAAQTRYAAHRKWLVPKPSTIPTLQTLRSRGYRLGLMSTCSTEVPALWSVTGLQPLFDQALFSCELGLTKADAAFYLQLCRQISTSPERTVYVGDSLEELVKSNELGMLPILMKTRIQFDWNGLSVSDPAEVLDLLKAL